MTKILQDIINNYEIHNKKDTILKISNTSAFKPYNTYKNKNKNKYRIYFHDLLLKIKIENDGNIKIINNIAELAEKCLKDIHIDFATSKI
jgi:hypothetical protein